MKNKLSEKQCKYFEPANKSLTNIGQLALNYLNGFTWEFPSDCPDPRTDAQGFADWCRKNGYDK